MSFEKVFPSITAPMHSLGLFIFRVSVGGLMFFGHGLGKLSQIGSESAAQFPDLLGIGSVASHFCASLAEGIGALFIIFGILTRLSALSLVFTMAVAAFLAHGNDPIFAKWFTGVVSEYPVVMGPSKEPALMYLISFSLLIFTGAGRFSLDKLFFKK